MPIASLKARIVNEVELVFKTKAILNGGMTLFKKSDAIQFTEMCAEKKLRVLGIDGFQLVEETRQVYYRCSGDKPQN